MNLAEIAWPVFRLGEHKPTIESGVIFYSKEYLDVESQELRLGLRVVDDKNINKPTLGLRRLELRKDRKVNMFVIKRAIYFLSDLIKLAKQTTWFIDNHGHIFQYKKITRAKLVCRRIKKVFPARDIGCIIQVEGLDTRFKLLRHPNNGEQYAGILQWGLGYILYGLYLDPFKPTYRLI
jgi:hypothetical protein